MSTINNFRYKLEQRRIQRENSLKNHESEKSQIEPLEKLSSNKQKKLVLSSEQTKALEKSLIIFLSDPLVDLPINSEDLLCRLQLGTKNYDLTTDLLNGILVKFSTVYKLIK